MILYLFLGLYVLSSLIYVVVNVAMYIYGVYKNLHDFSTGVIISESLFCLTPILGTVFLLYNISCTLRGCLNFCFDEIITNMIRGKQ